MTGGFGLEDFRNKMFKSKNIKYIKQINDASFVFGNKVAYCCGVLLSI
jgi:hypothetical protein